MKKVVLTQKQADAIENIRKNISPSGMIRDFLSKRKYSMYIDLYVLDLDTFVRALYVGYEVGPKFKVDDWVKVNWQNVKSSIHKVLEDSNEVWVEIDGDQPNKRPGISVVEHASPEEIAKEKELRW